MRLAAKGDIDALQALFASNPENLNCRGPHGRTLLWEAVKAGRDEAVRFLVQAGANVDLTGCYNSESHVQLTPYCAAVYYGRTALAAYLDQRSSAPDIFRQAFLGDEASVLGAIDADPALLAAEDPHDEIYFMPVLAFAVAGGYRGLVEGLIARGAEIEAYSVQLLFLSAKAARKDLMGVLVTGGADTNFIEAALIATKDIGTFRRLLELQAAANGGVSPKGITLHPILRADRAARPDKIAALLDHGVPIEALDPEGNSALHLACRSGQVKAVTLLVERGADPSVKDRQGRTPLDIANSGGKRAVAGLLGGGGGDEDHD